MVYNPNTHQLYNDERGYRMYFNTLTPFVQLANYAPVPEQVYWTRFDTQQTLILYDKKEGFYACMNTGDSAGYSKTQYELMYYPNGGQNRKQCVPVTVYGVPYY
ncbi:unnamed protein product [Ambrosiozyma monospora]|uniref:Unnamed protein product n=1 Tax=Ambrosiozyma monospora TaxID=43982 RepID=A0ACB5T0L8_AMBMO|nr:unnamed protein product [Ambrosiozyma monospora]